MTSMPRELRSQLYLVIDATPSALPRLQAVLARVQLPSLLMVPAVGSLEVDLDIARDLVACAQSENVAALLAADAQKAQTISADGVHLNLADGDIGPYHEARTIVGAGAIVGVTAGPLRHDAMTAGEAGADYIAFEPLPGESAITDVVEKVSWWSEIFEIPCVAFGGTKAEEWAELASAGADFVAVHCPQVANAAETVGFVTAAEAAITAVEGRSQ